MDPIILRFPHPVVSTCSKQLSSMDTVVAEEEEEETVFLGDDVRMVVFGRQETTSYHIMRGSLC